MRSHLGYRCHSTAPATTHFEHPRCLPLDGRRLMDCPYRTRRAALEDQDIRGPAGHTTVSSLGNGLARCDRNILTSTNWWAPGDSNARPQPCEDQSVNPPDWRCVRLLCSTPLLPDPLLPLLSPPCPSYGHAGDAANEARASACGSRRDAPGGLPRIRTRERARLPFHAPRRGDAVVNLWHAREPGLSQGDVISSGRWGQLEIQKGAYRWPDQPGGSWNFYKEHLLELFRISSSDSQVSRLNCVFTFEERDSARHFAAERAHVCYRVEPVEPTAPRTRHDMRWVTVMGNPGTDFDAITAAMEGY